MCRVPLYGVAMGRAGGESKTGGLLWTGGEAVNWTDVRMRTGELVGALDITLGVHAHHVAFPILRADPPGFASARMNAYNQLMLPVAVWRNEQGQDERCLQVDEADLVQLRKLRGFRPVVVAHEP